MPVLLSSLIDAPAEELAGVLAADEWRCRLRDWLALIPDPRSRLGRWHLLEFVLGLAVCAFTAALARPGISAVAGLRACLAW
jgi:hypothetical protein